MRWGVRMAAVLATLGLAVGACGGRHTTANAYISQAEKICACKDMVCVKATSEDFQKSARKLAATMKDLSKSDHKAIKISVKKTEECVAGLAKKRTAAKR